MLFCLPTSDVVAEVLRGLHVPKGRVLVDCTTGEPEAMARMGAAQAKAGVDYLDATVLGSSAVVRKGGAVVMAGGRREVFDGASPLFRTFAARRFISAVSGPARG